MTLLDTMNGPIWILWAAAVLCTALAVTFLSGRGSWLIAGYNTSSKKEKEKYDEKKLCRVMGWGMAVIAILTLIMAAGCQVLPAAFSDLYGAVVLIDCLVMIVLGNAICKK